GRPVVGVEGYAKPGAGFVGDRVQGKQGLTDLPALALGQVLERRLQTLPYRRPFLAHQRRERGPPILHSRTPATARFLDRSGPVAEASRWPFPHRGDGEAKRLGAVERDIREREHIRGPVEQLVGQSA